MGEKYNDEWGQQQTDLLVIPAPKVRQEKCCNGKDLHSLFRIYPKGSFKVIFSTINNILNLYDCPSPEELIKRIREHKERLKFILGQGYSIVDESEDDKEEQKVEEVREPYTEGLLRKLSLN